MKAVYLFSLIASHTPTQSTAPHAAGTPRAFTCTGPRPFRLSCFFHDFLVFFSCFTSPPPQNAGVDLREGRAPAQTHRHLYACIMHVNITYTCLCIGAPRTDPVTPPAPCARSPAPAPRPLAPLRAHTHLRCYRKYNIGTISSSRAHAPRPLAPLLHRATEVSHRRRGLSARCDPQARLQRACV